MSESFWACFGAEDCGVPAALGVDGCKVLGDLGVRPCGGMDRTPSETGSRPICPTPSRTAFVIAEQLGVPDSLAHDAVWAVADGYVGGRALPVAGTSTEAAIEELGAIIRIADRIQYPDQH